MTRIRRSLSCLASLAVLAVFPAFFAGAQESGWASARVDYYDDPSQVTVTGSDGKSLGDVYFGLDLMAGDVVRTGNSLVELLLLPGMSRITLSPNTLFVIQKLPGPRSGSNEFQLAQGKIRVVAQKSRGTTYTFRTPTAAAGVRGTEFAMEYEEGVKDILVVREGLVEFTKEPEPGVDAQVVQVAALQAADTKAPEFRTESWRPEAVEQFFDQGELERIRKARELREAQKALGNGEAARLAEIRKAGADAVALEKARQDERQAKAREAALARSLSEKNALELKTRPLAGFVLVKGGTFLLGNDMQVGRPNELPARLLSIGAYHLSQDVVSTGEFRKFVEATGYETTAEKQGRAVTIEKGIGAGRLARSWRWPGYPPHPEDPALCLSWYDAVAYCNWLSVSNGRTPAYRYGDQGAELAGWPSGWNVGSQGSTRIRLDPGADGFRLPTESEWEFAAESGLGAQWHDADRSPWNFTRMMQVTEWVQDLYRGYGDPANGIGVNRTLRGTLDVFPIPGISSGVTPSALSPSVRDQAPPDTASDRIMFRVCLPVPSGK